ncbi:MAG: SMP-30/gluconolactonase/LRE family protein [Myxococcota bacterium]
MRSLLLRLLPWIVAPALSAAALPLQEGDIVVTDNETGNIVRIDPASGLQTLLPCAYAFRRPQGVVATTDEVLFVNVPSIVLLDGELVSLTDAGCGPVSQGGDLENSDGIALDRDGTVIVSSTACPSCGAGAPPAIVRVDPVTSVQTPVSSGAAFVNPEHIAVRPGGRLYVSDDGCPTCNPIVPPALFDVDPATGAQTVVSEAQLLINVSGIALEQDGHVLVADRGCSACVPVIPSRVVRVDPLGPVLANQTLLASATLNNEFDGVAIDATGAIFVGVENSLADTGGVSRIDGTTGLETPLSLGIFLEDVDGIAIVVPEPGSSAAAVAALAALAALARARRSA